MYCFPSFGHFALQTALPPATSCRYAGRNRIGPMRMGVTMAALFTTPKRNDKTSGAHFIEPDVRRRTLLAHGSWRRVTRRIVVGAVCALTVSSLLMPSVSLAAEWVNVGGAQYNAGTAAGDAAGTWSWDGADDMKLNGYNGGAIEAAGKLNVSYEGNNTVTNDNGRGIKVKDGANENAELNIQGDASSTLNVTSSRDAITSVGNINIDGAGTVNATSTEHDAIDAGGDVTIKGSGNVNATGDSDGVRADGNITIDNSGTVTAKATDDQSIDANENLIIKGGGKVEASSIKDNAIWADGNIEISGGSQVKASSEEDAAIDGKNSLTVTNASLNASGVGYGIYVYKGITLDGATVTVRASSDGGEASALFTDEDDIVIKNGSTVDALAEGRFSVAISTSNFYSDEAGGHIYISDSVVKAIARYAETGGDGPDHYSGDQNDEIIPESEGLNIGIFAQTEKGITPATISIVRSKVTAEGDTAAIFALAMSADGKAIGTIEIKDAIIQTPAGGKVIDYRNKEELSDGIVYEAGQTIGTGDATIDSPYDAAVAKSTVIVPPEEIKPEEKPGETKPEGSKSEGTKTTKTVAAATAGAKTTGILAATGDTSSAAIIATALVGTAAIVTGALASRKRS
ncbi:carbohydrate-binding domain-containing protein [Collinsella sp. OM06-18AC]|nr:carbohydrate-binding domain-containing protein [Collinsella sp. OM06-18AC]RGV45345.1 carbohydrate-binding domain-containing protein [Collinsella sp. AF14-35]